MGAAALRWPAGGPGRQRRGTARLDRRRRPPRRPAHALSPRDPGALGRKDHLAPQPAGAPARSPQTLSGRLLGIGTGPGDPELVTLKAVRLTRTAGLVVSLAASGRPSRARRIMAPHLPTGVPEITVELDMGPDRTAVDRAYDQLALDIRAEVARGHDVAVLCEGDPLLFGTFIYLLQRLPDLPVEIVPGISSPHAAAARAAWPLATGDRAFAVLPATMGIDRLRERLARVDAAAIIKVGSHLPAVRALLGEWGLAGEALLAVQATTEAEAITPLGAYAGETAPYFSLVLTRGLGGARG
ncbi:MAG: precorrin-2 C(20)-methyltransferase [Geminicoccaceae bacterium]|nr:MAG: precorrin-2 C(20)-methyltransferase [Geminicoccaceae bacterium]